MGLSSNVALKTRVLLIDNYDSFTWNVYQYLACEGAEVIVHRNDKITLEEAIALRPDRLVVSPGPGHPLTDSGISCDVIRHFAGKIPIFGVCMGEQCIFSVFGGTVSFAGEIVHGKTSTIIHDGKGIFTNVPQGVAVTRYHSLSGTHESLPDELEVTARTSSGIIQGVRHRRYTIEGVQFHPESILTEEGRLMIRNFLNVEGGKWTNATSQSKKSSESILYKIYQQRKKDVEKQSSTPGFTFTEVKQSLALGLAPPVNNFYERLQRAPGMALLAEVKRASPSKGIIDDKIHAPSVALTYADSGAAAISVLTEPTWFKGSIEDLRQIRLAVGGYLNRPVVLRKEFIFDEYQIAEARLAGADSILLIVKMLEDFELKALYDYSLELGMEPLVEVSSQEEMERALKLGAKVIGVNNRDLHSFDVDLSKTSSLASMVPKDTLLIALSGISGPSDVRKYESEGIKGILVGESLMRARDVKEFAEALIGTSVAQPIEKQDMLVKVCGLQTAQEALAALDAGADFLGIIMVPGRSRTIDVNEAKKISEVVKARREKHRKSNEVSKIATGPANWATQQASLLTGRGPLLVGVFQNQPLSDIIRLVDEIGLDLVQLHGNEPRAWANFIPVPVIQRMDVGDETVFSSGIQALSLYDGKHGGTGDSWDWSRIPDNSNALLAGGLDPDNVLDAIKVPGILGVDVSSGVETNGKKDLEKIRLFVNHAKGH